MLVFHDSRRPDSRGHISFSLPAARDLLPVTIQYLTLPFHFSKIVRVLWRAVYQCYCVSTMIRVYIMFLDIVIL